MAIRLRTSATVVALVVAVHVWTVLEQPRADGSWDPTATMPWLAGLLVVAALAALSSFGRRRTPGWNAGWLIATSSLAVQTLGYGLSGAAQGSTRLLLSDPIGTALVVAGSAGLAAALWVMIRERLEITFATDFLAEGLLIGTALAYLFAVAGLASEFRPAADGVGSVLHLTASGTIGLLPLVFTVAALWLMSRLTRLTSEAPSAYRWLTLALAFLVLPAAIFAVEPLVRVTPETTLGTVAIVSLFVLQTIAVGLWAAASLDRSLARPFDPVPVPDRAATAHVPMMLVLGALGPLLASLALWDTSGNRSSVIAPNHYLLLFGSLLLPMVTAAQLIRRVHIEYSTVTRDQVRHIAETKMVDLNANDIDAAMKIIEGTARSMGILVNG